MSSPRLLIDSDVMLLLSGSGILEDTVNALGFDLSSAFHLEAFPYMLKNSKKFAHVPQAIRSLALHECAKISSISSLHPLGDQNVISQLSQIRSIDPGEAAIYSAMYQSHIYYMASGDKNSMKALASDSSATHVRDAIAGRVICLEKICMELVSLHGVPIVANTLKPVMFGHVSLNSYFNKRTISTPSLCHQAIESDFRALRTKVGYNFLWNEGKYRIP